METSLKTGFAQIFSCCPKNLSCPKFGGLQPPSPRRPVRLCMYTYILLYIHLIYNYIHFIFTLYRTYIRLIEDVTQWREDMNFIFE